MDPLINPSSVLPVDFLPGELLQSPEEGDDGHALHDSMQFHLHEVSSLAEHRSTEAIFDTDHPKHARHRQLSMDGMIDADDPFQQFSVGKSPGRMPCSVRFFVGVGSLR